MSGQNKPHMEELSIWATWSFAMSHLQYAARSTYL